MANEEGAKEIPAQGCQMGTGLVGGEVLCGPRAACEMGEPGTDSWRGQLQLRWGAQGLELGVWAGLWTQGSSGGESPCLDI